MELLLYRTYLPTGTNGELYNGEQLVCYTIELPWQMNARQISCIPEGRYQLKRRWEPHRKNHLEVTGVKGRDHILIHPANNALLQLKGCIAPVMQLTGPGRGRQSRIATQKLRLLVYSGFLQKSKVYLTILNQETEQ